MAARHLRRLQEQLQQQSPQLRSDDPEDLDEEFSDDEPAPKGQKAPFNPFDLLSDEVGGRPSHVPL